MKKVFIIAGAGINHNGKLKNAIKLIDIAANAKVDAVKFQLFNTSFFINKNKLPKAFKRFSSLEFNLDNWKKIIKYCKKKKLIFFVSIFDEESLVVIKKLNIKIIKIPSGEINNIQLLKKINKTKLSVILSTGMSTLEELKVALKNLNKCKVQVLHCVSEYPTKLKSINLNYISTLKKILKKDIGFSDHSLGSEVPALAVAAGATIIEKHITYNKNQKLGDHKMSINEKELTEMVNKIRSAEVICGNEYKKVLKTEKKLSKVARKGAYIRQQIKKGQKLKMKDIIFLRPSNFKSLLLINKILDKKAKKNLYKLENLKKNDFR